jgi:hypothetical protein
MEAHPLIKLELAMVAAFAVYLVFAQLSHMKKLKQRDQAKSDSSEQAASGDASGRS